jgi:AraC family transcriptional regulator of adaptative response/methylated-DNA-[protein]-cysteine methyltransferase
MMHTYTTDKARWQAVLQRDQAADGQFFYGVVTTGIYCRPGCTSKRPKRENVVFFQTREQAESAEFRPCKRCQPNVADKDILHRQIIIDACQRIAASEEQPTLSSLAEAAGYSPTYFQKIFKKIVGVTPKQYASAIRAQRVRENLQTESTITAALYDAGFNSSSHFYDTANDTLGMTPSRFRNGGVGTEIRHVITRCYLGWILIAATSKGVCAIEFADNANALEESLHNSFPLANLIASDAQFKSWVDLVLSSLEFPQDNIKLPLDIRGTAFQQRVWAALRQIPVGESRSYSQIAESIDQPTAVRAVANACANNKIAVAIPCHRVVRKDGNLGGYKWGLERKRKLLEKESQQR